MIRFPVRGLPLLLAYIVRATWATSFEWAVNQAALFVNNILSDIVYLDSDSYQQRHFAMARTTFAMQWHPGEKEVHKLILGTAQKDNPTYTGLAPHYAHRVTISPLVAFGTLDDQGRPWTTVWGGEAGFCRPIAENVLGVRANADSPFDPVIQSLLAVPKAGGQQAIVDDELVKPEGGKVMAALSIDLETRDRVKIAGRFVAGAVSQTADAGGRELQMALHVEESLGNCPKYLNKKQILPHTPKPQLISEGRGLPLPPEAVDLISKADLFFISSKHGNGSMDTNHRGGPPAFVRLFSNSASSEGGVTLIYPEYSGNRLYQTLGNLQRDPYAGIVIPDFETGNVLYLTGRTTTLMGEKASAYMSHTKLAVKIDVEEARFVKDGLAFRGKFIDYSPYNPSVRQLVTEQDSSTLESGSDAIATATLVTRDIITPTISRFVFKLSPATDKTGAPKPLKLWQRGQHVTFDFSPELDHGWSHMRDDDPQSLNDDFVRTFTVSIPPPPPPPPPAGPGIEPELEITVRRHGPATGLLWNWNLRVPLELPVLGFAGSEDFYLPVVVVVGGGGGGPDDNDDDDDDVDRGKRAKTDTAVFVAAGVGITPLTAQARDVLRSAPAPSLRLLWSLRGEDLPLAARVLTGSDTRIEGLAGVTRLFVTGGTADDQVAAAVDELRRGGVEVAEGRMQREHLQQDVAGKTTTEKKSGRTFYCCTGPGMMADLTKWLEGEDVRFENFNY